MKSNIQLKDLKYVYFLGIGGIGMSAIARWFLHNGFPVFGYDKTESPLTKTLSQEGMQIHYEDDIDCIPKVILADTAHSLFIYTPAIPANHAEKNYLLNQGIPLYKRSEILGWITQQIPTLAVAGTHGKTTTSSLLTHLLIHAQKNVTAFLGGITQNYGTNYIPNKDKENIICVVEADEYDRSFLTLHPYAAVVTSTDADHLDIYGASEQVVESFQLFVSQIQSDGFFIQKDGLNLASKHRKATFGIESGDYQAVNIRIEEHRMVFDMLYPEGEIKDIPMRIPGFHNIENALAAAALARQVGLSGEEIKAGIASFKGVKRRFEYHLETPEHVMIDDYAHHPTEIAACLKSVKALYPDEKIVAIFQPHLFSRTRDFLNDFAQSLSLADELYLLDIYPARELPIPGVSSEKLLDKINLKQKQCISKEGLVEAIKKEKPALLVTMGAGDIDLLLTDLKAALQ
ncbi:UDP-N-acetylmuramate--L-alanine ligase [Aquirufa rosea]|uniref:UDP-N-acetylmuramate--L-alanine ligase n=1 Tax=Aquirufa rosea TaxID=2509241 RepID=A0A4Q1C0Z7_9BACT|nr:UDP-N-acetylmuramate--L-alanine ligase [Aquirufa rosea]RXK50776.1 UDP-N-acetylmuramate--L-alanine ligase [Aquirufa rosea]